VGFFLVRVLENLDRSRAETFCYSDRVATDELTSRLQAAAGVWRDATALDHAQLAQQIRADGIDVLFDLAGHTADNRLLTFARKPAPIQLTWLGYAGTTGLVAMDYLLADRYEVSEGAERHYQERVLRLPDGYVCYDPPRRAPAVSPLPALQQGYVTFGSFNNPAKINAQVAALWANILRRVPRARLMLKYTGWDDAAAVRSLAESLVAAGVEAGRLQCHGWSPHAELLAHYQRVDLAIDPFPYSGGLTTCEALWMGVPVVTCPGETFASRHSLSHLSSIGLTETVARDPDHYVELAVALAQDLPRLAALRARLRPQMESAPLCDGPRLARNLLTLLRRVWQEWLR
jgi:protein O-GlcNAc transferase